MVADLVRRGFEDWSEFHRRYSDQKLGALDPGLADWSDLASFALNYMGAQTGQGFSALRFRWQDGEVHDASVEAPVLRLKDGTPYACGDFAGMPISGPGGADVKQVGLNLPLIATALREAAFPEAIAGAVHVRWPEGQRLPAGIGTRPFALWIAVRQSLRLAQGKPVEVGSSFHVYAVSSPGNSVPVEGSEKGFVVRSLGKASIRREPEAAASIIADLNKNEQAWITDLRRPTEEEREGRIAHAVTPLLAAIVS